MVKNISTVFNAKGRLSQTEYAYKTVSLSDPIVAIKCKYLFFQNYLFILRTFLI